MGEMSHEEPRWRQDIVTYQGVKSTFILTGNVHDRQIDFEGDTCFSDSLPSCLYSFLTARGYTQVVFYNRVLGFHNDIDPGMLGEFLRRIGDEGLGGAADVAKDGCCAFGTATGVIAGVLGSVTRATAVVFDMVTSSLSAPDRLLEEEREAMARLLAATEQVVNCTDEKTGTTLPNVLILVADKPNDVPSWFYVGNPYMRVLTVTPPSREERLAYIRSFGGAVFSDAASLSARERERAEGSLANMTEGFSCVELDGFLEGCARGGGVASAEMRTAVDRYRYGVSRDYWSHVGAAEIEDAERLLHQRIKGQDHAIAKAVDILYRASAGLSLTEPAAGSAKPRGVLFLAGPTGTGKTELAKSLTEAIFSDESLMVRFDMSEFSEAHSDQRLFGAPPGYVGYDEGGELTNAVRQRPHCLLLFDEIEKAHRTILDKFLQILDDGRLTDSHGETVYFGETVILFTSNLGMSETDPYTGKRVNEIGPNTFSSREEFHREVERRVKQTLRAEFINRVGENFVVFDFIDKTTAHDIMASKLQAFARRLKATRGITLCVERTFLPELTARVCSEPERGGRGIVSQLQSCVVDPLGRVLVREHVPEGSVLVVKGFVQTGDAGRLDLAVCVTDEMPADAAALADDGRASAGRVRGTEED